MAKRQGSLSLSFVLLRFALVMLGCMLLCCLFWLAVQSGLQTAGIIYHGSVSNQQVEEMLEDQEGPTDEFVDQVRKQVIEWLYYHIKTFDRSVAEYKYMHGNPDMI